jgi:uncharacterized membrane protein
MMKSTLFTTIAAMGFLLTACGTTAVNFDGVKVDPNTMNKGESLTVTGKVSSFGHSLSSVSYSIVNSPAGITVSNNALGTDKFSWDLSTDAQLKIVTTDKAASGNYKLTIEAKADDKSESTDLSFTVR